MKNSLLLFALYLVISSSCNPILKTISGIKNIKLESRKSLTEFCAKMNIDEKNSYVKIENYDYPDSSQINFKFADQVLIYNYKGERIIYNGPGTNNCCSLPKSDFFSGFNSIFLPIDTVNNLNYMLKNYQNIVTNDTPIINNTDYYLVYYWANWYKGLTKYRIENIKEILNSKNDTIKIQCFYLNNDLLDENYPANTNFKKIKINVSLDR